MANKHRKVWKVVSRKVNSRKQTWPEAIMDLRLVFSRSQLLSYLLHDWIWDILMKITSIDSINRWILVLWATNKLFVANICLRWII
jgi:hypothetical protein